MVSHDDQGKRAFHPQMMRGFSLRVLAIKYRLNLIAVADARSAATSS